MAELKIAPGTRMTIALSPEIGKEPDFSMSGTFYKAIDESAFLLSIPLKDGKPVTVSETDKLILKCPMGSEYMILAAYCDDVVKQGVRHYWKLRRVSEQRQFFQRADERYKLAIHVEYLQPTWTPNAEGVIVPEDAMTVDISAGGAAIFLNSRFDVGETCEVNLPGIGVEDAGQPVTGIVAAVCWYRDAPKGSPYRFLCGLQFRFGDDVERTRLREYIANIKAVYKL